MSMTGVDLRNVQAGTINISGVTVGLTAVEVQELTKAAAAGAVGPLADKLIELSQRLGVTYGAALTILRTLGHDDVPIERLPDALAAAATQILAMRQTLSRPSNDEGGIADLKRQAVFALDAGALNEATRLLNVIRTREQEASERRRQAIEESRADWLAGLQAEAETCVLLARAALAQRDTAGACARFEEGVGVLAPTDSKIRWSYAFDAAEALFNFGTRIGGNGVIAAAIHFYETALVSSPRERVPSDWARTQKSLSTALRTLGNQENGTARLEAAVIALRAVAVLEENTRERTLLNWAGIQNNLGNALTSLGKRESGVEWLKEAVVAYKAALKERTRERVPLEWAATQNNLGNAFNALGEKEGGVERLKDAVAAYHAVLEVITRKRVLLDWAKTQNNLGSALHTLGRRESGRVRLRTAVRAFRAALEERTREQLPLVWAMTQNNLGNALLTLGKRESGTTRLKEAILVFHLALEERRRELVPFDWAITQNNLGNAFSALSERVVGKSALLDAAVTAYSAALEEITHEHLPTYREEIQNNLDVVLLKLKESQSSPLLQRQPGALAGKIHMSDDFDTWPPDLLDAMEA